MISFCQLSSDRAAETPLYFKVSESFGPFISLKTFSLSNITLDPGKYRPWGIPTPNNWNFFWSRSFCRCSLRNSVGFSIDASRSFCVSLKIEVDFHLVQMIQFLFVALFKWISFWCQSFSLQCNAFNSLVIEVDFHFQYSGWSKRQLINPRPC